MDEHNQTRADDKAERIRRLVQEAEQLAGPDEKSSDQQLIASHPELMPELAEELAKRRVIRGAAQQAAASSVPPGVGSTRDSALHVRCPHCQSPIELVADVPWEELICPSCGSSFNLLGVKDTTSYDHADTKTLGHFELIDRVGMGAFGTVWMARDLELDRTVALKIPRKGQLSRTELEQFMREARAAAQLRHPHIVSVHEVGREDDTIYIVSDFVHGATLADWLTGQRLSPREAAQLCVKLAEALHHAHELGVVHRDLKPSNIMLDRDGEPHLMDFGLAKREAGEITMTLDGKVLGTPAYMSPEQARGEAHQADRRSDIYSLGVILFELLTNELPFRGNTRMLIVQILNEEPPSPRKLNSVVPGDLETICLKCLEKDAKKRYQTAAELADDLKRFVRGEPITARPVGRVERTWRWCKRQPVVAGLTAAVFLTLAIGATVSSWFGWNESLQRKRAESLANDVSLALDKQESQTARLLFEQGMSNFATGDAGGALQYLAHGIDLLHQVMQRQPRKDMALELSRLEVSYRLHLLAIATDESCEQFRLRHDGKVNAVAFSPDGTKMATASADQTARLWDTATGKPLGEHLRHDVGTVAALTFSPDGTQLATASYDKTARLWDVSTGKPLGEPLRHDSGVTAVAFNPDGTLLATASYDNTARLWDVGTGKPRGEPFQHDDDVFAIAFSPNGARFATASWDKTARIWDVATGKPRGEPFCHDLPVTAVAFSPDGTLLATASADHTARLWDITRGTALGGPLAHDGIVTALAFNPDGTQLTTASADRTARLWDVATNKPHGEPMRHDGRVFAVAFGPDGTQLATASGDRTARLWDVATSKPHGEPLRHDDVVFAIAFSLNGARLATASWDKTARLWNIAAGKPLGEYLQDDGIIDDVAFSPDGTQLATVSLDNTVRLWDVATRKPLGEPLRHDERINAISFSPDGTRLVTASWDNTARLWDIATGKPHGEPFRHDAPVADATFSPDGTRIATASPDKTARLWDTTTGKPLGEPIRHDDSVNGVAFSPDGTQLATASGDRTARLWNVATRRPYGEPLRHDLPVSAVAFSPGGTRLATASDRNARLWDIATGKPLGEPLRHDDYLRSISFSPDGTQLATASGDFARLWDVATGKPLGESLRHDRSVNAVAFSPDGTQLATASLSSLPGFGSTRLWDVFIAPDEPAEQLQLWVEVVTGAAMDDTGTIVPLSTDALVKKREELDRLGGPPKEYVRILAARRRIWEKQRLDPEFQWLKRLERETRQIPMPR